MQHVLDFIEAKNLYISTNEMNIRGLWTDKAIPKNEIIFTVPYDKMITSHHVQQQNKTIYDLACNEHKISFNTLVAIWASLHHYNKKDSAFRNYLQTLPKTFDWLEFTQEDIQNTCAGYGFALPTLMKSFEKEIEKSLIIYEKVPQLQELYTKSEFQKHIRYLIRITRSRCFQMLVNGVKHSALVPGMYLGLWT